MHSTLLIETILFLFEVHKSADISGIRCTFFELRLLRLLPSSALSNSSTQRFLPNECVMLANFALIYMQKSFLFYTSWLKRLFFLICLSLWFSVVYCSSLWSPFVTFFIPRNSGRIFCDLCVPFACLCLYLFVFV